MAFSKQRRDNIVERWLGLLGPFPSSRPALDPVVTPREPIRSLPAWHVSFQTEADDRVTAYLLKPQSDEPLPAVVCIHPTTEGSGKDRVAGLAGAAPDSAPDEQAATRAYGVELAERGYVTLCIDLMCDGERVLGGAQRYDTSRFYERHPEWSAVGKNVWDTMVAVDFLQSLEFVNASRIGCAGHSLGGHSSLFAAALDERIAAAVCNCGALRWNVHWSRLPEPGAGPVDSYVYLPRLRPYLDANVPPPVLFSELMMLVAPRALLIQTSRAELAEERTDMLVEDAREAYVAGGAEAKFEFFSFAGGHSFPPEARLNSYTWLDRWLGQR